MFIITFVPLMIVGLIGRLHFRLNYLTLSGLLGGSYTDPPALAYATQQTDTDAPAVGYSTVYPLTMFLRILAGQAILLSMM